MPKKLTNVKVIIPLVIAIISAIFSAGVIVGTMKGGMDLIKLKHESNKTISKLEREIEEIADQTKYRRYNSKKLVNKAMFTKYYLQYFLAKTILDQYPNTGSIKAFARGLDKLCDYIERRKSELEKEVKESGDTNYLDYLTLMTGESTYNLDGDKWPLTEDIVKELNKRE